MPETKSRAREMKGSAAGEICILVLSKKMIIEVIRKDGMRGMTKNEEVSERERERKGVITCISVCMFTKCIRIL